MPIARTSRRFDAAMQALLTETVGDSATTVDLRLAQLSAMRSLSPADSEIGRASCRERV